MKHIFIVNPAAGKEEFRNDLSRRLHSVSADFQVYLTKAPKDATRFVRKYCSENSEPVRFYACGGDGTLSEVAAGIVGFENAELSCCPCGSGNDFVKYYGGEEAFRDIEALINAPSHPIDLIKINDTYSLNVVNFGFDTHVAKTMEKVRNKKIIGGKNAYNTGVFSSVLFAMKNRAEIYADGERLNPDEKFLLCTAANGKYVGGAFQCAPRSVNNDGLMEICMVKPISRFRFVKLLGPYTAGKHLDDPSFKDIIEYRRCSRLEVNAPEGFSVCIDGELLDTTHFVCEVMPGAIRFAVPASAVPTKEREAEAVGV